MASVGLGRWSPEALARGPPTPRTIPMDLLRLFRRTDDSTRRLPNRPRRPLVEALEGRQLLSGFTVDASAVERKHVGTAAMIQGNHIGVVAAIQGNHIGTAAIQGNHIGVAPSIVGNHIGTSFA
jgi:hypothetical protein